MNGHNDNRLYEASMNGDVENLSRLIEEDPLVLTRITPTFFRENPLHIAALHGHSRYVEELLRHHPQLAEEVDAWGHTALHLASAKGYVATVKVLVKADSGASCLRRNSEGRLALHLAIMKRHVEVVRELVRAHPEAAREAVEGGQNAAHLCVRSNYLEGLRAVVEEMHHDEEFLASVDENGNTILHLAAAFKHSKMVEYIIALRAWGEILENAIKNSMPRDLEGLKVANSQISEEIQRASMHEVVNMDTGTTVDVPPKPMKKSNTFIIRGYINKSVEWTEHYDKKWVETMSGWLIIVAILVATVAFQAGVQPPGGVWPNDNSTTGVIAGSAVAARNGNFFGYNSAAFVSSLSVILLLVSGAPVHNKCCTWVLVLLMWATLTFMTLTYSATMYVVAPPRNFNVTTADVSYVLSLPPQGSLNIPMLSIWFLVLGGVLLYQLLVMLVWLSTQLHHFTLYLRSTPRLLRAASVTPLDYF